MFDFSSLLEPLCEAPTKFQLAEGSSFPAREPNAAACRKPKIGRADFFPAWVGMVISASSLFSAFPAYFPSL